MFAYVFNIWGHAGDLSKLCLKCVTDVQKKLKLTKRKSHFGSLSFNAILAMTLRTQTSFLLPDELLHILLKLRL